MNTKTPSCLLPEHPGPLDAPLQALAFAPRIIPVGDCALTVEFGRDINPQTHALVLGFAHALGSMANNGLLNGVIEWVPAFCSVTVHFEPDQSDPERLADVLLTLAHKGASASAVGCRWHIPVCFEPDFAPDLEALAAARHLQPAEVVRLMTSTVFTVYMLGFLPGFPYLGGLPAACEMPRLQTPRIVVPARSIAVAGRMCAAYPWESPGGWRLLGRTPVRLFDPANTRRPALLAPGDEVVWRAIDRATYETLEAQCAQDRFDVSTLLASGVEE